MGLEIGLTSPFGLMRALSTAGTALERATLRARGVRVRIVGPGSEPAQYMARGLMSSRHASDVHAGGYRQGLELGSG